MGSELLTCFQGAFSSAQSGFGSRLQVKDSRTTTQLADKFCRPLRGRRKEKEEDLGLIIVICG